MNKTRRRWLCEAAAAFAPPLSLTFGCCIFHRVFSGAVSWTSSHGRGQSHGENRDFRLTLMHLCGTVWKFSGLKSGAFWCVNDDFWATAKCAHRCFPVNCLPPRSQQAVLENRRNEWEHKEERLSDFTVSSGASARCFFFSAAQHQITLHQILG